MRRILGQTQSEFAAMIGASKDTIVSWECGRNRLSMTFARRIAIATGVDGDCLLKGVSVPFTAEPFSSPRVYTAEDFERHRKSWRGRSDEEGARHHLKHCADALELIFMAAVRSGAAKGCQQLPAVLVSFIDWCEETRRDFGLEEGIDLQLQRRRLRVSVTQTYREWRAMLRESPAEVRAAGFKDEGSKRDNETLRLEREVVPGWAPGRSMNGPKPGIMVAVKKD